MEPDLSSRTCPNCKIEFTPKRSWQKFCNGVCQQEFWKKLYRAAFDVVKSQTS